MSVRKPKFKNIPMATLVRFVRHHLPYELWMMREALKAAIRGAPMLYQHNADVEAFALHARNLIEFLKNGDNCSYNPVDFAKLGFGVDRQFIRQGLIDKINEQIQHLTANRTEETGGKNGKFEEVDWLEAAGAIEKEIARWINALSSDWAGEWENRERMDESEIEDGEEEPHFSDGSSAPAYTKLRQRNETTTPGGTIFRAFKPRG